MLAALLFIAAATDAAAAPAAAPTRVLVLDVKDDGVGAGAVGIIHDSLVAALAREAQLEVLSTEDVRRVLDIEAQKSAMGCTGSDESCLAEIAGALDARLLVYGTAGKLGDLVVVNLSLYDAERQRSVSRETIEADRVEDLPPRLRDAAERLTAGLFGPPPGPDPVLLWAGVGTAAVGVVGGAIALGVGVAQDRAVGDPAAVKDKQAHKNNAVAGYQIAAVGGAVVVVGAALAGAALALE
jgi:hypothetical protein